jgi:hypothetical protein
MVNTVGTSPPPDITPDQELSTLRMFGTTVRVATEYRQVACRLQADAAISRSEELVSVDPAVVPIGGPPPAAGFARQADAGLGRLLATVLEERSAMHAELRLPLKRERRSLVQRRLLAALELYASALSARGLLAPPKLRDELALQRGLAARR